MKWIAVAGSRTVNGQVERDVRREVRGFMERGDGLVAGGALGVDYIATDEALKIDPEAKRIKIFIPAPLPIYASHYRKRAQEEAITEEQAEKLISQLTKLQEVNSDSLQGTPKNRIVTEETYYERHKFILDLAEELIAFQVNNSPGTADTIEKARQKGIQVKLFTYKI